MSRRGKYTEVLKKVFERKYKGQSEVLFTQDDLRVVAVKLKIPIRNFPDLIYNLRSRAPLPKEILSKGFKTIEMRGRGIYALTSIEDVVMLPKHVETINVKGSLIPEPVIDFLLPDEQSVLSAVLHLNLVEMFMAFPCFHLQNHLRTTGSLGQQVEADDIYVGLPSAKKLAS